MDDGMKAEELYKVLQRMGIKYTEYTHPKLFTVDDCMSEPELASKRNLIVKNIWLRDDSKRFYIMTALSDTRIAFRSIRKALNIKSIYMGTEEHMKNIVKCSRGNLSPFSVLNDKEKKVKMILEKSILHVDEILAHPLHNAATICVSTEDLLKFLKGIDHDPIIISAEEQETDKHFDSGDQKQRDPRDESKEKHVLGVTVKKSENFGEWFSQAIVRSGMIEYYDISGCYIYLPPSYFIWEVFQEKFNVELRKRKVENCYFPMFVSSHKLEKEKDHIEGFSPEVAWVTKYGDSEFANPIAIRPTSETIMYPEYSKWIKSYRDLPLKLNQWNSVVRWEFKQPTPFIRSREFLWQEGHTAHKSEAEALETVYDILDVYKMFYEDYMAVPVIKGVKSDSEKFAGGKLTTTVETFIPEVGRGVQAATSHLLGTSFAKMFEIEFEDENGKKQLVHQTSWGFTLRSIGIMFMVHGDDKGLVIPPKVAKTQVVIIPIPNRKRSQEEIKRVVEEVESRLTKVCVRCYVDDRMGYTPGFKFNHWELRGVPLRIEIGQFDVESRSCKVCRRDSGVKASIKLDSLEDGITKLLDEIQTDMLKKAKRRLEDSIVKAFEFKEVMPALNSKKMVLLPWSEDPESEVEIKNETQRLSQEESKLDSQTGGMKSLCIPLDQPPMPDGTKCFWTGKPAKRWTLWGRSY